MFTCPPEYAIDGQFSVKSDVYSIDVILIEIGSGVKHRLFNHPDQSLNLLGHVSMNILQHFLHHRLINSHNEILGMDVSQRRQAFATNR